MSLLQCSLFCVWFPNEAWWHLLDEPNSSGPISLDSASRNFFFPLSRCSLHLDLGSLTHMWKTINTLCVKGSLTYRALNRVFMVTEFLNLVGKWHEDFDLPPRIFSMKEHAVLISVCDYSFLFGGHLSQCFRHTHNKEEIWNTETHYWQK